MGPRLLFCQTPALGSVLTPFATNRCGRVAIGTSIKVANAFKLNMDQIISFAVSQMRSSVYMLGNTSELGNSEDPTILIYNP